jgi:hypothetical protein
VTASERFHLKRKLFSGPLWEINDRLWAHPDIRLLYPELLFRIWSMARASVPLMERALEKLRPRVEADPIAEGLVAYLEKLCPEEVGHDEWILEDLEVLGHPREQIEARLTPPTVAAVVGAQYYYIEHCHPVALVGYIAVQEADPAPTETIERLIELTGLPRTAFRNYLRHAILEPRHHDYLDETLDSVPFSERDWALMGTNLARTIHLLGRSVEEMLETHERESRRAGVETSAPASSSA